jgi:N6-adenosine-specific RNA methylase IME4
MSEWVFGDLKMFGYDLICADPPWHFKSYSQKGKTSKSAASKYKLMDLGDIEALPVGQLARPDTLLLLWCPGWAIATGQAQQVARAWGFNPVTELVWRKVTGKINRRTKQPGVRYGTGYRARSRHEPILVCTMGDPVHKAFDSLIDGIAREHSRKPDEFYEHVRQKTPNMFRCDLFSRFDHPGFDCWGDEQGKFNHQTAVAARTKKTKAKQKRAVRQFDLPLAVAATKRRRWSAAQAAV